MNYLITVTVERAPGGYKATLNYNDSIMVNHILVEVFPSVSEAFDWIHSFNLI